MPMTLEPRASRLLDLMREAGDEAVSLDELEVVGVEDPSAALLALELAGFRFDRVHDNTARGEITCVRLSHAEPAARATPVAPIKPIVPAPNPARTSSSSVDWPPILLALVSFLLVVALGRTVARRRG